MFDKLTKISELFFKNSDIKTDDFYIVFELDQDDFLFFDKELYVKKNGNLKNFSKSQEIELNLNGVKFLIKNRV